MAHELSWSYMFISRHRQKLINAIIYFVQNTNNCNTIKLFKLLNFLDFEHFRQTGESVTGLNYYAWEQGPVPSELWHELKKPNEDFSRAISVLVKRDELTDAPKRRDFQPIIGFNPRVFTKRELQIMERLTFYFKELTATEMSSYSHGKKMPWYKVYNKEQSNRIPYELTLDSDKIIKDMPSLDKEEIAFREDAYREIRAHMK